MDEHRIPTETHEIITAIREVLGDEVSFVLVGGSVRDLLLGQVPKDYDVATALPPEEVEKRVRAAGKRAHTIGKRFGTIGFKERGHFIEVTTFRSDLYDFASRKPQVVFTDSLEKDLARRDFTINAMALTPWGELIDPFGGSEDLERGFIRAVGKPGERFREDPLRMLRMVRFVARFGFTVDEKTANAAVKYAYLLGNISAERIGSEMDGLLVAPYAVQALQSMVRLGLLPFAVPLLAVQVGYDQHSPYHRLTLWEHSLATMQGVAPELELRWAALLHDIGKPFVRREKPGRSTYVHHDQVGAVLVEMTGRHLKWSRERIGRVRDMVRDHMQDGSPLRPSDNKAK